ncbi:MAG: exosortase/archaeosortase family protein [Planctomycetaceae bacterium]|nr:exosortase/archaeosortase family protein [Planctomycetaceae bacterium]MBQ2821731.1 exosortase/archaeosortase family protein [Thermoguttaceae bacterium]MDO4425306.1 exosortase/archaeosortase family protein [Planctomycetia bacterium]
MSINDSVQKNEPAEKPVKEWTAWSVIGGFLLLLIYAYWNMFESAMAEWSTNELYSHGYLIPILAIIILYMRRQPLRESTTRERLAGMGIILAASFIRIFMSSFETGDMYTFVIAFTGLIILVGGTSMLRWAGPVAFLLLFMFPLPHTATQQLLVPMQHFATHASTVVLKILGFAAFQDGNSISLGASKIDIVEQCSGLKMTTIFLALSISLVLINEREWWENLIILLMAIPIALITNITRIVTTGMAIFMFPESETLKKLVHDGAGLLMVPLAIALLVLLQWIISHIFVEGNDPTPLDMIENPQEVFWKDRKQIED